MSLFKADLNTFWLFGGFVLFMSYAHGTAVGDSPFFTAYSYFLSIPIELIGQLFVAAPLIAIIGALINILFFHTLVEHFGEGYVMIIVMAFLAVLLNVGMV